LALFRAVPEPYSSVMQQEFSQEFSWAVIVVVAATIAVLVAGIITMLKPGPNTPRRAQRLMRFRLFFQAAAVILIATAFLMNR
jgi:hypothetical protein